MMIMIEKPKCPIEVWGMLRDCRDANIAFTPVVMEKLLSCTNHPTSIRDILKELPKGREIDFKEAIISMVEHRKHTESNIIRMREIACLGGFEEEFEEAHAKDKRIGKTYKKTFVAKSIGDLFDNHNLYEFGDIVCDFDGYKVYADSGKLLIAKSNDDLQANPDLTKYDMVICDFEGETKFADLDKLPKKMIIKGDVN